MEGVILARVLVLDGSQRKCLAAVRSLARAGHTVFVADERRISLAGVSRFCAGAVRVPAPAAGPRFCAAVTEFVRRRSIDVVLPMDDDSSEVFLGQASVAGASLLLPDRDSFASARDKGFTQELATRVGVRFPLTLSPSDLAELDAAFDTFSGPVVIKPRIGSGARGIRYFETPAELVAEYRSRGRAPLLPLIQEWIRPVVEKVHVASLSLNGNVLAWFTQRVIREWPVGGGVGTLWESVNDAAAIAATQRLLNATSWTGIALTEFLYTDDNSGPILMEMNPRFWNTLELAIACGVDFPSLWVSAALGQPQEGPRDWPVGVTAQWLFPGDLLNLLANPRRFKQRIGYWPARNRVHAVWRRDDPLPTAAMAAIVVQTALNFRRLKNEVGR